MAILKGDKVRFLNDVGGGMVTRIVGSTAYVEDADGFEIPALLSQIVLVESAQKPQDKASESLKDKIVKNKKANSSSEPSVFLAFLVGDKPGSQSGDYRLHFINDTDYQIVYLISGNARQPELWDTMYQGIAEPFSQPLLDKIPGRILDDKELMIQLLFFKNGSSYKIIQPIQVKAKLKLARFMREGAFIPNSYFNEKAWFISLLKSEIDSKLEELKHSQLKENESTVKKEIPKKSNKKQDLIEIDLHINDLLDDIRGLSNGEILKIQLNKFEQIIQDYQAIKGQRIVFIHGVGNGVLKQEILKLLKTKYKNMYYQDASFKEYGYGATMVII
jgi:hypothetical protein